MNSLLTEYYNKLVHVVCVKIIINLHAYDMHYKCSIPSHAQASGI